MSTNVSSVVSHFPQAQNGFTTTTAGSVSSGAATVTLQSVGGYTDGKPAVFVIDPTDATKKQTFTGIIDTAGVQVTNVVWTAGTDQAHALGATVVDYATATHMSMVSKGIEVEHDQDGTHGAITTTSINNAGATTLTGALTIKSYDGWIGTTDTWVYASATTFTIAGVDRTAQFPVGTKIKLTQTTPKYFYVTASSFSTNTTVTVTGGTDYTLANAAITSPASSYDDSPQAFPQWFNYLPTFTNYASVNGTILSRFCMSGRSVKVRMALTAGSSTTLTAAILFTFPVTPATSYATEGRLVMGEGTFFDSSAGQVYDLIVEGSQSTTVIGLSHKIVNSNYALLQGLGTSGNTPVAIGTSDVIACEFNYEA